MSQHDCEFLSLYRFPKRIFVSLKLIFVTAGTNDAKEFRKCSDTPFSISTYFHSPFLIMKSFAEKRSVWIAKVIKNTNYISISGEHSNHAAFIALHILITRCMERRHICTTIKLNERGAPLPRQISDAQTCTWLTEVIHSVTWKCEAKATWVRRHVYILCTVEV